MGKYFIGILICIAFIPYLGGFRSDVVQKSISEISVSEINTANENEKGATIGTTDCFLFDAFSFSICDIIISMPYPPRVGNSFRMLKFTSTLQFLSSLDTLSTGDNSISLNFRHKFVKTSYRYFIYSLRRLLI